MHCITRKKLNILIKIKLTLLKMILIKTTIHAVYRVLYLHFNINIVQYVNSFRHIHEKLYSVCVIFFFYIVCDS